MQTIRDRIEVDCPFSTAIDSAQTYLSHLARVDGGRVLRLPVPVPRVRRRLDLAWTVYASATLDRDRTDPARCHDALWIRLRPKRGVPFPDVAVLLTARPSHGHTMLHLTAEYEPPFGLAGAAIDRIAGRRVTENAMLGLLAEVKRALEAENRAFVEACSQRDAL